MAIRFEEKNDGKILEIHVSGKLTREEYKQFVPEFERLIKKHGKLRLLFEMSNFHGWETGALWEDAKLDLKHFSDIDRLAIVGESKWQEWMAKFCRPFTTAKIRYFDHTALAAAQNWVSESQKDLVSQTN